MWSLPVTRAVSSAVPQALPASGRYCRRDHPGRLTPSVSLASARVGVARVVLPRGPRAPTIGVFGIARARSLADRFASSDAAFVTPEIGMRAADARNAGLGHARCLTWPSRINSFTVRPGTGLAPHGALRPTS